MLAPIAQVSVTGASYEDRRMADNHRSISVCRRLGACRYLILTKHRLSHYYLFLTYVRHQQLGALPWPLRSRVASSFGAGPSTCRPTSCPSFFSSTRVNWSRAIRTSATVMGMPAARTTRL